MSSAYTALISGLVFPLQERFKRRATPALRASLERSQWWPPERLEALRLERLRGLLERVERVNPYYRRRFGEIGFAAAELRSLADLGRLPLLDKPTIRANLAALRSEDAGRLARFNTGGSSGEPLIFHIGERVSHDVAAKWRATRWWDVDIGDPEIVLWGSPIELGAQDRLRALRDALMRTELLPAFELSEAKLDRYLSRVCARRPRMLFGYPSALARLARHAAGRGIRMDDLGIRVAFVTAERLYEEQRATIAATFGCRVANGYGARDAGFIAHQCPAGGMHITAEDVIVEIVGSDGNVLPPGRAGEVVVTHLATGDFPFIRYRTGDVAVSDDALCACGRTLPLLREIQGRSTDFVVARDGTVMHGLALIYVLRDIPGIEAFKVIQESLDLTRVLLVAGPAFQVASITQIVAGLKQRLGAAVTIQVERVEQLASEASGKYRFIVSKVSSILEAATP
ncbi:phenylacetate-coenzyme A ligase [mine drainage metagenome]|uniref:Phenylacetate-coenzyme A ligase n=1 Tax=mine drainage metagenome TaxID=410659 RepID=A0A1J5SFL6_9ZZZZ